MSEWLAMGGYAGFVWGSYGLAALAVIVELTALGLRRRRALARARVEESDAA